MLALIFGLISAFSFGISNAYWKIASKNVDYPFLIIFRGIFAIIFFVLLWITSNDLNGSELINSKATISDYFFTTILCLICSLGLMFFLKSIRFQNISITVPFTSINIFNILTTVFIVGESFKTVYYFSFSFALLGILLLVNYKLGKINWNQGATYAILASFFWGITYPLFKFVSPIIGAIPLSLILEACVTLIAIIWVSLKQEIVFSKDLLNYKNLKHYLILSILLVSGTFSFNLAIQKLSVLSLNLISNVQILISILMGVLFYKEKLSKKQILGIILILISISISQFF